MDQLDLFVVVQLCSLPGSQHSLYTPTPSSPSTVHPLTQVEREVFEGGGGGHEGGSEGEDLGRAKPK